MANNQIHSVNTRQLSSMLQQCLEARVVPMIHGSPGVGKSAVTHAVADKNNLALIDQRMSTAAPEDQNGLPFFKDGKAQFAPFADLYPLQDSKIPEGKDGWLVFLDEINSASKAVMASAYKLILDRKVGTHSLHDNVALVAAGNLATDRAIVNNIGTALQSRMVHLELRVDHRIWMEDVALAQGYDERIIGFLNFKPDLLMDFRPDHNDRTFCCPRTWEFMNRLLIGTDGKPREIVPSNAALYAGTITSGAAVEFISYCRNVANLISIERVLEDPEKCPVPHEAAVKWATTTHLLSRYTNETLSKVLQYIERFDASFKIMFVRSLVIRDKTVVTHPAFATFLSKMTHLLND